MHGQNHIKLDIIFLSNAPQYPIKHCFVLRSQFAAIVLLVGEVLLKVGISIGSKCKGEVHPITGREGPEGE